MAHRRADGLQGQPARWLCRARWKTSNALARPTGPTFAAAPGQWEIGLACKADLHSPDNSYSGVVTLECLDAAGKVIERFTLADVFGKRDWQPVKKQRRAAQGRRGRPLPRPAQQDLWPLLGRRTLGRVPCAGAAQGRPHRAPAVRHGAARQPAVSRRSAAGERHGRGRQAAAREPAALSYVVRDYWGAEQSGPRPCRSAAGKEGRRFIYQATIDLADGPAGDRPLLRAARGDSPQEGERAVSQLHLVRHSPGSRDQALQARGSPLHQPQLGQPHHRVHPA